MRKTLALLALATFVTTLLALPATAFAGGDQVNRPDEAGYFSGGQQAEGELPPWAPREQQGAQ